MYGDRIRVYGVFAYAKPGGMTTADLPSVERQTRAIYILLMRLVTGQDDYHFAGARMWAIRSRSPSYGDVAAARNLELAIW